MDTEEVQNDVTEGGEELETEENVTEIQMEDGGDDDQDKTVEEGGEVEVEESVGAEEEELPVDDSGIDPAVDGGEEHGMEQTEAEFEAEQEVEQAAAEENNDTVVDDAPEKESEANEVEPEAQEEIAPVKEELQAEETQSVDVSEAAPKPEEEEVGAAEEETQARVSSNGGNKKAPTKPPKKDPEAPPVVIKKHKKTYPFLARHFKEDNVQQAIRKPAPPHDYFGLIFSAETERPPNYYHNYFMPLQKQPLGRQHMKVVGKIIPQYVTGPIYKAPVHSMPLSAIKIRWQLHRRNTLYKSADLYAYLGKYGQIDRVYQVSNNSAIVVFEDLKSAMSAIKDPRLGYPWDALIAEWVEPRMNNRTYFKKYAQMEDAF